MTPVTTRARRILVGAALSALLATGALAQQTPPAQKPPAQPQPPNAVGVNNNWQAETKVTKTNGAPLDEKQQALIKRVDAYLNDIIDLQGRFLQTGADKKQLKGRFFVHRPGKCRFVYGQPSRQVIVCDGNLVHIEDHDLKNKDSHALDSTPFRLLLRKDTNLARDSRILDAQEAEDVAVVSLVDKGGDSVGQIKLFFVKQPAFELKEWVITDAQGLDTRIEVSDLDRKPITDPKLFESSQLGLPNANTTGN